MTVAPPRPSQPDAILHEPTLDELGGLASFDARTRLGAADTLMQRAVTPELTAVVNDALMRGADGEFAGRLVCLKSRFDDHDTLEFLVADAPWQQTAEYWEASPDSCLLEALTRRIEEDPERIRDKLLMGAFTVNGNVRSRVLKAYRRTDLDLLPLPLLSRLEHGDPHRREAVGAALALGAIRHAPDIVRDALYDDDRYVSQMSRDELVREESPKAAELLASVLVLNPVNADLRRTMIAREQRWHDVSRALLDIAVEERSDRLREAALELISATGEVGAIEPLQTLAATTAPPVRGYVDATLAELRRNKALGSTARMRQ